MSKPPTSIHIFKQYQRTPEDLSAVQNLRADNCPHRYCWWWKSLSFEWNLSVTNGFRFSEMSKPEGWKNCDVPCRRNDRKSEVDHFEPREAQLIDDGIDATKWINSFAKAKPES
jgi:hypothetical protein